jgi:hypothetical protein
VNGNATRVAIAGVIGAGAASDPVFGGLGRTRMRLAAQIARSHRGRSLGQDGRGSKAGQKEVGVMKLYRAQAHDMLRAKGRRSDATPFSLLLPLVLIAVAQMFAATILVGSGSILFTCAGGARTYGAAGVATARG